MATPRAHIVITTVQVPFTRGGAEILVDGLKAELRRRDFAVDVVALPCFGQPKEQLLQHLLLWRGLDIQSFNGKPVDLVIGTKFPSYYVRHPRKVCWLVHQHRLAYDLYGSRFGDYSVEPLDEARRQLLMESDRQALQECSARYAISSNVAARLRRYLNLDAQELLPPLPLGDRYYCGKKGNYILSVGRICSIKRVDLLIKALPAIDERLIVKVIGTPDEPATEAYIQSEIAKHHLQHRVEFLGRVDEGRLLECFANAFAVYYAPYDEDYGYVTLEAFASGKPVITASDSGGVLSFVRDGENGLVAEATEPEIAETFNRLFRDEALYTRLSEQAKSIALPRDWDAVCSALTAPLSL